MTFDFAPDWMNAFLRDQPCATAEAGRSAMLASPQAPPHPDAGQLAALVNELFMEGTLSPEQFRMLSAATAPAAAGNT